MVKFENFQLTGGNAPPPYAVFDLKNWGTVIQALGAGSIVLVN